jgi:hydrogenase maturation protein HypF
MAVTGRRIRVRGRVQGVGFRPFVWRLARDGGLTGHVRNDGTGVSIDIWGSPPALDAFTARLQADPPSLARVTTLEWTALDTPAPETGFGIVASDGGAVATEIAPDAATCDDCLAEIRDPQDRRYRYPFTNCTHCGPRLSIVEAIPYDRATTSMRAFAMCDACRGEYDDPADRRFHAQPNACPACGPQIWIEDGTGRIACADPLAETARRLRDGAIVAIKGIGGVHLACDARNAGAVAELRRRKRRQAKPLAVMGSSIEQIRTHCHVSEAEARLLSAPAAPIVLLHTRDGGALSGVAPGLGVTGFMLPNAPLHHLLMDGLDGPIVLTSGNASGMPQVTRNADARTSLAGLADAWLLHDRDIVNRLDDSIARVDLGAPYILRRGRGLAPGAIRLNDALAGTPPTLALGAELKSTFCLLRDTSAIPSQHIGDLKTAETLADFRAKIGLFRALFHFDPEVIAIDRHPDYLSARVGQGLARETGARLVAVQHHHAHLASCLAEHRVAPGDDRSVGIVLDGTGFGPDGTVWGGEILLGGYRKFERKAHLSPVALPGGQQAVRQPWRNTVAHLSAALGPDWTGLLEGTDLGTRLGEKPVDMILRMVEQGVNAPLASSAGRLFDAVAGALGVACDAQRYEGQAAMELEALAAGHMTAAGDYPFDISEAGTITFEPLWRAVLHDLKRGVAPGVIAARFHNGLAAVLAEAAGAVANGAGTGRVVLSGGVMQNRILLERLHGQLTAQGFDVLVHRRVPANDGGISLGQAAVAALG